jgi:hypothetical protein
MFKLIGKAGVWYTKCLAAAPYTTNCVTGFLIAFSGDIACQSYFESKNPKVSASLLQSGSNNSYVRDVTSRSVHQPKKYDFNRAGKMGMIRAVIITPLTQYWYTVLLWTFPGASLYRVLCRVALDQAVGCPVVIVLVFYAKAILDGQPGSAAATITSNLLSTWRCGLQYWPFVHTINFGLVPPLYQPLFSSFASLYWQVVLSYYANNIEGKDNVYQ